MALDDNPRENDRVFDYDGVRVLVDEISIGYLSGAKIDYVDELMGSGFKIENPNAVASCGCGHSFRTSEEGGSDERLYGIYHGNDGQVIFLPPAMYEYLQLLGDVIDADWMPYPPEKKQEHMKRFEEG